MHLYFEKNFTNQKRLQCNTLLVYNEASTVLCVCYIHSGDLG